LRDDSSAEVVNLDKLTYAGNLDNLKDVDNNTNYKFVKGDICDRNTVDNLVKEVDVIVNFAAETHVDRSIVSAGSFVMSDVFGTYTLLEAARKNNVKKFIHIGTDEVYGSTTGDSFTETDKLNPSSPYAASKAGADLLALSFYHTYGVPVIIARSTNNFGPYQHPEKFIPKMIINAILNEQLPVYGKGDNVRDWLFVEDNCSALQFLLSKGKLGEIYNVAGSNESKNLDVIKLILEILGKDSNLIKFVMDRPAHDFRYSLNAEKIHELGWKPSNNFEENLRKTIEWYKTNDWWWKKILSTTDIDFHTKF
jgi:dTDP-glucose 4,6-dehydratase